MKSKIEARDPEFLKYEIGNLRIELIVFIHFANVFSCNKVLMLAMNVLMLVQISAVPKNGISLN